MATWPTEGFYWVRFHGRRKWEPAEFRDGYVRMLGYIDGGDPRDYIAEVGPPIEPPPTPRVTMAIRWANGNVMVFDARGEQLPDLQGRYEEVRDKVLATADDRTRFLHATWGGAGERRTRETW